MNNGNGKVRIYELSKELNLDNKDILAICEQLAISVKSHSSTISDSEAEQIRSAAETYTPSHPSKPVIRQGVHQSSMEQKSRVTAPIPKKQQIVAIKSTPRSPNIAEPPNPPSHAGTNSSEASGSVQSSTAPTAPSRTSRPVEEAPVLESPAPQPPQQIVETDAPELGATFPDAVDPAIQSAAQASAEPATRPAARPTAPEPDKPAPEMVEALPKVVPPPPRTVKRQDSAAPTSAPARSTLTNKPILKRPRADQPSTETPAGRSADSATRPGSDADRVTRLPMKQSPQPARAGVSKPGSPEKPARPQQTIVELRRPKPVRPSGEPVGESRQSEDGINTINRPELKINRPRPRPPGEAAPGADGTTQPAQELQPKPALPRVRKGKDWDEEEENKEALAKVAKGKTKRRAQPDLDEDVDLDNLLVDEDDEDADPDAPAQVSLSLVRPPKPKSARPTPTRSTPTTASPRKKTFDRRDRRDRREENKVEKPTKIVLTGSLTVQELAAMMIIPETDIIRTLFMKGIMATVTQTLDIETATMVANELEVEVETGEKESAARKLTEMLDVEDLENLHRRPPVVTIMGHVDHGKTSLLDSIRKTKVAQGEAGGITQHIGAYHVDVEHNDETRQIVFLDTPGHEAFTAMRARGARVTDIAVLVVAADDGVQPQTIEAISHAKAAEVPIVVAINKVDKEEAQPDRVKQELTEYNLVPEEWGGDTIMVPVSAITGQNLDNLLEMLLLVSEMEELSANPDRVAKGTVIEAHLDKAKGPTATLLVQNGTLHVGDVLVAGSVLGKVRAMVDDRGHRVKEAGPSYAVEVLGLSDVPAAGDEFLVFQEEKEARAIADTRSDEQRQSRLLAAMSSRRVSLNTLSARAQEGDLKELNLVLKADVQGSIEAILGSFKQLPQNEVQVRVLYAAPGEISETDIDLAAASSAVIIGFNTTLAPGARQAADRLGVDVRDYNIIYKLLDDIQAAMEGLLDPEMVEEALGEVEVRAVFPVGRGQVAGCYVKSGKVIRNCKIRIRRKGEVIHTGTLDSLKRMKEDAREVNAGYECGIGVDDFNSWQESDMIEAYRMISKRRTLSK
jgi:translation initiation factor IF-2